MDRRITLAIITIVLVLSSCTKVYIEEPVDRQIIVFPSIGGAGDNGYNDLITKGLTRVYMDHSGASMNYLTPETMEQAENQIYKWIKESGRKAAHTLLVLAASDYRDITEKILLDSDFKSGNGIEILTFEIPELPQSQNNVKAYSFMISMNDASYQAGVYAARMGYTNPLIWLAYSSDALLIKAADGFEAGYKSVTGLEPDRRHLSEDWHGYSMDREAYMQMEEIDGKYDFIYPVMGGSNMGIYRYLRENPDGPCVAGMDVDQSPYSSKVVGNVIKHIDNLLEQIVRDWINGVPIEHYIEYDTQSGYIEWCPVVD
ncbi:MAG: BMP family ABC transporter substrate-binding protein [Bacteroidaceae bacterium]|nr:BMP family ABC transporter substrate-binding protein [Bacteroidaceae bacterium]